MILERDLKTVPSMLKLTKISSLSFTFCIHTLAPTMPVAAMGIPQNTRLTKDCFISFNNRAHTCTTSLPAFGSAVWS